MITVPTRRMGMFAIGLSALGLAAFSSVSTPALAHDDVVHESRDVGTFTHVRVKGAVELHLTAGKAQVVDVATDSDYMSHVKTYVEGDTLVIDMTDEDRHGIHWGDDDKVEVTINVEKLEGFEVLGAVDGDMKGFTGGNLSVEIKGAAHLEIEGTCDKLDLDIKGAGKVNAEDFKCREVDVAVKGVGAASVYASESVDADVGGIGSINVYGSPKTVHKSAGGIGTIHIR